jgi:hypothetical protein
LFDQNYFQLKSQRHVMELVAGASCYTPFVASLASSSSSPPPPPPSNVHAVLHGGYSQLVTATSSMTEFAGKPIVSFGTTDDVLSNKVSVDG